MQNRRPVHLIHMRLPSHWRDSGVNLVRPDKRNEVHEPVIPPGAFPEVILIAGMGLISLETRRRLAQAQPRPAPGPLGIRGNSVGNRSIPAQGGPRRNDLIAVEPPLLQPVI